MKIWVNKYDANEVWQGSSEFKFPRVPSVGEFIEGFEDDIYRVIEIMFSMKNEDIVSVKVQPHVICARCGENHSWCQNVSEGEFS